jgi:hypothetical protein
VGTQNLGAEHGSEDIAKLINLGPDIPKAVRPKLDEVPAPQCGCIWSRGTSGARKREGADPVKEGTQPVSMPMYSASPAKKEVIDKQTDL